MKRVITLCLSFIILIAIADRSFAQTPNSQRKKPTVKKTAVKPLPPPPPPEPVKEPTMEETREWLQKKLNQYKPSISFTSNQKEKDQCEWIIEQAIFDTATNNLTLTLRPDVRSVCYKDELTSMVVDLTWIDITKTTPVESSKKILLYQRPQNAPFELRVPPTSSMYKSKMNIYSATISFDKSLTYETNLTTRFGKALNKMSEFKGAKASTEKEAY